MFSGIRKSINESLPNAQEIKAIQYNHDINVNFINRKESIAISFRMF
jgi:hypothetical protein